MLGEIRRYVRRNSAGNDGDTVIECRQCGHWLDTVRDACSECGSEEIASYEL
jgi:uncharacterized OB-fold protein